MKKSLSISAALAAAVLLGGCSVNVTPEPLVIQPSEPSVVSCVAMNAAGRSFVWRARNPDVASSGALAACQRNSYYPQTCQLRRCN